MVTMTVKPAMTQVISGMMMLRETDLALIVTWAEVLINGRRRRLRKKRGEKTLLRA
jgi:hypothetical protein